ncbi:MAG: HAD-IIIA family hydrolase [Bacteroidales bacterium]|nr:HAD-IIIA family hydrolase [Bacteroidales bacterium]
MKAVILAGGKGTRLGNLTQEIPKPMILIGGKPLLQHQVDLLVQYGFREIIILVNYLKDPIIRYFGDGSKFGASIHYFEEPTPLGTVGGIKEIENQLTGDFLVLYGDVMVSMDLNRLIAFHTAKNSECTLVLHPNDHPHDSDLVEMDDESRIIAFHAKPHPSGIWYHNMVNAGVYILSPVVLKMLEKGRKADFGRDIFPMIYKSMGIYGYHTTEYLKDMGTPDRLEKVQHDLITGKVSRSNYENKQSAVFLDRDGVLNVERSYISRPEDLQLYDYTAPAIKKLNQAGLLTVVVTNQSAVARNLCTEEEVKTIHKKMETELGEQGAWLDAIHYCPHHPDKGFPEENPKYKIDCDCRKPKTGMFRKAIDKFNIDPGTSYMIGDSERDIKAGANTGCVTIGVRTGYGIKKTSIIPDFMFSNLAEAVSFIVDEPYKMQVDEVFRHFENHKSSLPYVILIGGNTRTGKSTLAACLRISFEKLGHQVLQVGLDNWILPEEDRSDSMNVYDRFRLMSLEKDIAGLIGGETLKLATYANHPDRNSSPVEYDPSNARVIIIEGVVALSSTAVRQLAHLKLFTAADKETFRKRFFEYYGWRGKTVDEIALLFEKREQDEFQLIEKESKLADLIIN